MKRVHIALLLLICLLLCSAKTALALEPAPVLTVSETTPPISPTPKPILLGDQTFTGQETSLAVVISPEAFEALESFPNLSFLDLSGSTCYAAIMAYKAAHPEVEVRYTVTLGGVEVPEDAAELTLPALDTADDLVYLPQLRALTVEAPISPALAMDLSARLPEAELTYSVAFAGLTADKTAAALDLSAIQPAEVPEAMAALAAFPQVTKVKLSAADGSSPWTLEQAGTLMQQRPELQVEYTAAAFGVQFSLTDPVVSFSNIDLHDQVDELRAILPYMSQVGRLDMEYCSIPDEQMAALRSEFSSPKIVWRVFLKSYSCRTDAIMVRFSERNENKRLVDEDMQPLTYCNEIRYLDLGHNRITNADFAASMPELEVCILSAENKLSDISALASCKKLEYLEIFTGKVTDISALASCKDLKHLNICNNSIRDISPLFELDLERLWLAHNGIPAEQIKSFRQQFPNCQVNDSTPSNDPTVGSWRDKGNQYVARYQLLREQFCYDHSEISSYSEPPVF